MPLLRPHKHLGTGSPALDLRRPALLAHHGHSERLGHGSGRGRGRVNEPLADGLRKGGDSRKTGPAEPSLDFCFKLDALYKQLRGASVLHLLYT